MARKPAHATPPVPHKRRQHFHVTALLTFWFGNNSVKGEMVKRNEGDDFSELACLQTEADAPQGRMDFVWALEVDSH